MNRKRGFTLVELLVVIAIIALLIGLLLPALAKARQNAQSLKDKTQIQQVHKAALGFAGENKGKLPIPGLIKRLPDPTNVFIQGQEDVTQNTTARLYSAMIARSLFNPDLLIGTTEVNPLITQKQDYNFNAYQPASSTPTFWDDTFVADPSSASNASYSHGALCGQRKKAQWRDSANPGYACFGTRGTGGGPGNFGGATTGTEYTASPTLQLHGPKQQWNGHVVFNDNHAETLDQFFTGLCIYRPVNSTQTLKDNIYAAEFNDYTTGGGTGQASGDSYMGMFVTPVTALTATPKFDPTN